MPFQHQNSQIRLSEAADGSSTKSNRIEPGELGGCSRQISGGRWGKKIAQRCTVYRRLPVNQYCLWEYGMAATVTNDRSREWNIH